MLRAYITRGSLYDRFSARTRALDTYLEDCERDGIEPEEPFSGKITVRVSPVLHRRIAIKAAAPKESMNQYLEELIQQDTKDVEAAIGGERQKRGRLADSGADDPHRGGGESPRALVRLRISIVG
ncbi:MAG: toxin-antitoxin system HicB family antitoxin [Rectinemataceae bacterium]